MNILKDTGTYILITDDKFNDDNTEFSYNYGDFTIDTPYGDARAFRDFTVGDPGINGDTWILTINSVDVVDAYDLTETTPTTTTTALELVAEINSGTGTHGFYAVSLSAGVFRVYAPIETGAAANAYVIADNIDAPGTITYSANMIGGGEARAIIIRNKFTEEVVHNQLFEDLTLVGISGVTNAETLAAYLMAL